MGALRWPDLLEILLLWAGIYVLLRSLKGTRGLGVLRGSVGVILLLYAVGRLLAELGFPLQRLIFLMESLVTVALLGLIIVFQPEIRRGLTRLGERPFQWLVGAGTGTESVSPIARAAGNMSRRRIGALVVMERNVGISGIVESGVQLAAEVTSPLLESIFYPNAPLHDGAVVVRGTRVVAAKCLLPLSDTTELGAELGTRHRAAVGVTEETDAIVVVVSEQTGRMSVAHRGDLKPMRDVRELESTIAELVAGGRLEEEGRRRTSSGDTQRLMRTRRTDGADSTHIDLGRVDRGDRSGIRPGPKSGSKSGSKSGPKRDVKKDSGRSGDSPRSERSKKTRKDDDGPDSGSSESKATG